jgi:signal transduction histidine kinase
MTASTPNTEVNIEYVPFKLHPRVFQALGSELVTSDIVAIIELVKNSYDAFATKVDVRFYTDKQSKHCLEIVDNGEGMDRATIDEVWCMVATPFRELNPKSQKGGKMRRTTGAKGLGRLSAARLGDTMTMITKSKDDQAWQVDVNWAGLSAESTLAACHAKRQPFRGDNFEQGTGTIVRINGLISKWRKAELDELGEALSRLVSPFEALSDFDIFFTPPGAEAVATKIVTSEFLKHPPYTIVGGFSKQGELKYDYFYRPAHGKNRNDERIFDWAIIQKDLNDALPKDEPLPLKDKPGCGPFKFEIRVWNLDKESMAEAESKYEIRKSLMRRQIRAFKGISLYRDRVLVLPKSESNRDWLGLDLRRVSKVGTRLSTSQMVGYVSITADSNPDIDDTSDRERLARNEKVEEFESILKYIISRLESERDQDQEVEEPKLRDLFGDLSPQKLIEGVEEIVSEKGSAGDVMPLLNEFSRSAERARQQIEKQFSYYSRLATIGTISEMLVHEVGNNCGAIDSFLECVREWIAGKLSDHAILEKRITLAEQAVEALQRLAEKFRPLASHSFQRGKRVASLKEAVDACLNTLGEQIKQCRINVKTNLRGKDILQIDPGELYPIVYNLLDNAVYWLHYQKTKNKTLRIESRNQGKGVVCNFNDTGPGVDKEDIKKIFNAGVTRKPNGSGMGLTVAGELVEGNNGKIWAESPGILGGATFAFELPSA